MLFAAAPIDTQAEAPKIDHIVELLQQAKASDHPMPLLEKARAALKDFKPSAPRRLAAADIGHHKSAGIQVAAQEHKRRAMEAVNEAIHTAKEGGDVKPRIDSAIAQVHSVGQFKH